MPILKTVHLTIPYRDTGPRDGPAVLLVHGWPDDASTVFKPLDRQVVLVTEQQPSRKTGLYAVAEAVRQRFVPSR